MVQLFRLKNKLKNGIKLTRAGQTEEAIAYYTSLLAQEPTNLEARLELSRHYFKKDDYASTKQMLLELLKYNPPAPEIKKILEITNFRRISSDKYFNAEPCFSPDGGKIVYSSARRDTNHDGRINSFDRSAIYLHDLKTGEEKCLVSDEHYSWRPSFSADGKKVVYLSSRRDTNQDGQIDYQDNPGVYIFDLETNQEKIVLPDFYKTKYPSFSPDGEKILFAAWRAEATHCGIYLLDWVKRELKTIGNEFYDNNFPSFSPDGTKIVYTSWRSDTNNDGRISFHDNTAIYLYDLKEENEYQIVPDVFDNLFPVFSPDGRYIAYVSYHRDTNRDGKIDSLDNPGIYLYDLGTRREKLVVSDEHYNKFPIFTFDSKGLVYIGSWRGKKDEERNFFENKGIYLIETTSKNEQQIVSDKYYGCREVATSPIDCKIAYISWHKKSNRGLYLADLKNLPTLPELEKIIEENL
jgi:Tol biopolymer transport system component